MGTSVPYIFRVLFTSVNRKRLGPAQARIGGLGLIREMFIEG